MSSAVYSTYMHLVEKITACVALLFSFELSVKTGICVEYVSFVSLNVDIYKNCGRCLYSILKKKQEEKMYMLCRCKPVGEGLGRTNNQWQQLG